MILVDSDDIKLTIGDTVASGKITDRRVIESISTGRELRLLKIDVTFTTPADDEAMATLAEPTQVAASLHDGTSFHCEARVSSSSYRQGDSERNYSIDLQEVEGFALERLEVAGEIVHPTSYREDTRHDLLTCFVRAPLTEGVLARFWELRGAKSEERYFDVRRHGISGEPRKMRFGRILWQELQNCAEVAVSFVLVDKSYDDDPENRFSLHGPEEERTRQAAATTELLLEGLLERLTERSVVSSEEVEVLRRAATREQWQHQKMYFRVDDLDQWE